MKHKLILIIVGLAISFGIATAQGINPPNFWKQLGGYIYPTPSYTKVGTSTTVYYGNGANLTGISTSIFTTSTLAGITNTVWNLLAGSNMVISTSSNNITFAVTSTPTFSLLTVGGTATSTITGDSSDSTIGGNLIISNGYLSMTGGGGINQYGGNINLFNSGGISMLDPTNNLNEWMFIGSTATNTVDFVGNHTFASTLDFSGISANHVFTFPNKDGTFAMLSDLGSGAESGWRHNGVNAVYLATTTDNVGIGTTTPTTAKLVIAGTPGASGIDLASTDQYLKTRVIQNDTSALPQDMYFMPGTDGSLFFYINGTTAWTIATSGDFISYGDGTGSQGIRTLGIINGGTITDGFASFNGGALTGASGNISQWTNDSSYLTLESDPIWNAASSSYYLASNPSNYITLSSLSATNPITYNSGTGAIGWTNSEGYVTSSIVNGYLSTSTGNWLGTWQNKNYTDFLSSSTVYVASESDPVFIAASGTLPYLSNTTPYQVPITLTGTTHLGVASSSGTWTFTNNGVTSFNGATGTITYSPAGSTTTTINTVDGPAFLFKTSNDTNITISLASSSNEFTWTAGWTGTLADSRIASAGTWNTKITTTSLSSTATGLTYTNTTGVFSLTSGYEIPTTASTTNWMTAYADRLKWDGGSTGLVAATGRTSLGLGTFATADSVAYASTTGVQPTISFPLPVASTSLTAGNMLVLSDDTLSVTTTPSFTTLTTTGGSTMGTYLRVGSDTLPAATNAGDMTVGRLNIGTNSAFGQTTGLMLYGSVTITTSTNTTIGSNFQNSITMSSVTAQQIRALNLENTINNGSASLGELYGGYFINRWNAGVSGATGLTGVYAVGFFQGGAGINFGTISNAYGGYFQAVNQFSTNASGTITNAYAIRAVSPTSVAATTTNAYGVYIDNHTKGVTTNVNLAIGTGASGNFSIYNSSAYNNYLAGFLGLATSTPTSTLQVGTPLDTTSHYVQLDVRITVPASGDCDADIEIGRMIMASTTAGRYLWTCWGAKGWGTSTVTF